MELLYYFFIYGFIGWILENIFCYVTKGHFQKEGFLIGPFKPMYAIGVVSIIVLYRCLPNRVSLLLISLLIPTIVEFITGIIMRRYFDKNYWDYSNEKFNYKGIICLRFSLAWVILSIFTLEILNPYIIEFIYSLIRKQWGVISIILVALLVIDEFFTLKGFAEKGKLV